MINYPFAFSFALLSPFIFSVFYGVLNINVPSELTVYILFFLLIILIKVKNDDYNILILNDRISFTAYLFFLMIIVFSFYTISNNAVIHKFTLFIYLIIIKILVFSLINYNKLIDDFKRTFIVIKNFAFFIILISFLFFYLGFTESFESSNRVYLVGSGNPIWFSRYISDLVFIIIFFIIIFRKRITLSYFLIICSAIILLIESGSRGPVLSLFVGIILVYIKNIYISKKKLYIIIFVFCFIMLPILIPAILDLNIYSVIARLNSYEKSIEFILSNPYGHGLGSFGLLYLDEDIRSYPHNIMLEILVEFGVFGFIVFLLFIYYGFKSYSSDNLFFYLFLISLINAQLSGDITSNSNLFIYLYLSAVFKKYKRRNLFETLSMCNGKH